jgi:hypothetical protein
LRSIQGTTLVIPQFPRNWISISLNAVAGHSGMLSCGRLRNMTMLVQQMQDGTVHNTLERLEQDFRQADGKFHESDEEQAKNLTCDVGDAM